MDHDAIEETIEAAEELLSQIEGLDEVTDQFYLATEYCSQTIEELKRIRDLNS